MEYIKIDKVAEILGVDLISARAICRFFGVSQRDAEVQVGYKGTRPREYSKSQVESILGAKGKFSK